MKRRWLSLKRDIEYLGRLDTSTWLDLGYATIALAYGRLSLLTKNFAGVSSVDAPGQVTPPRIDAHQAKLIDRVAFAIPRVARRVPWRADCLVQALAAQSWLRRRGIATTLVFGARKPTAADFEAHAWLKVGDRIVIGGEVSGYSPFASETADNAR